MKLFYAFIFTISSTTLAFPQLDPINQQLDKVFKNENGILTFQKASALVPKTLNKLLAESHPDSENGYLVIRDTKAENYFVVSDKAKDKIWSAKLNHIGYVVYKAMKYTKAAINGTIGQPVALKRYLEATCVNTEFPVSNELKRLKLIKMDEGDLIKIDTGKKGCFMPMKLDHGKTIFNLIVTGKWTEPHQLLISIERELASLKNNGGPGVIDRDIHVENLMVGDSNNLKMSVIGGLSFPAPKKNWGFSAWKWNGWSLTEQRKREMRVICYGLKESLKVSLKGDNLFLKDKETFMILDKGFQGNPPVGFKRFEDVLSEICLKKYYKPTKNKN